MECVYLEKSIEWLQMAHRDLTASPTKSVGMSCWVGVVCNISDLTGCDNFSYVIAVYRNLKRIMDHFKYKEFTKEVKELCI